MAAVRLLVLAAVLLAGAHPMAVAVLAIVLWSPLAFLGLTAAWGMANWVRRWGGGHRRLLAEARFFGSVASEVEAGASVRHAVQAAAADDSELPLGRCARLAASGGPLSAVAGELTTGLPANGRMAAAAIECISLTGAPAAPVFRSLELRAREIVELDRERRVGTAQARLTASAVGGAPLLLLLGLIASGRAPSLEGPAGVVAAAGLAMIVTGAAIAFLMLARAR